MENDIKELFKLILEKLQNSGKFYKGEKKFVDIHPNFELVFEGYKSLYNPYIGGASLYDTLNKVIFQYKIEPSFYIVLLESGSYLVKSNKRFIITKPFAKNKVEKLNYGVL